MAPRPFSRPLKGCPAPSRNTAVLHVVDTERVEPTAIDLLEGLLEKAKTGEITFVAAVVQYADGNVADCWSAARACRPFSIIGALTYIAQKFAIHHVD